MWNLISFVKRGRVRRQLLKALSIGPNTPTELARETKNHRPSVSRALIELEEKNLVRCLTPNEKLGRFYSITESGKKVTEKLHGIDNPQ